MSFDRDEIELIQIYEVTLILGQPPHVVEQMSDFEREMVIEMHHARNELHAWAQNKAMKKARMKR